MLSGETTNTNFIVFDLTPSGLEPTIYHIRGEHANHYAIDAVRATFNKSLLEGIVSSDVWRQMYHMFLKMVAKVLQKIID